VRKRKEDLERKRLTCEEEEEDLERRKAGL